MSQKLYNKIYHIYLLHKKDLLWIPYKKKVLTADVIPTDPVFIAFDLCVPSLNTEIDIENTRLRVYRNRSSRRNESSIINDVSTLINNFFKNSNNKLGQSLNILQLTTNILAVDGVDRISTYNAVTGTELPGLHFLSWNPIYFDISKTEVSTDVTLENLQFPYINDNNISERIVVL